MSRRELMKLGWWLGAAAIAPPSLTRRVFAKPHLRCLSVLAGRRLGRSACLTASCCGRDWRRSRSRAAACRWRTSRWTGRSRATRGSRRSRRKARRSRGRSSATASTSRSAGSSRDATTGTAFAPATRSARSAARRTAPPAGAAVDRLRFAVCGCSHYETGYFTAFRRIAEEQFDFVFHTGDYIYEGRGDGGRNERVRQHNGDGNLHARRLSKPLRAVQVGSRSHGRARLGAVHRDAGTITRSTTTTPATSTRTDTPPEIFLLRRAAAYQAYYETMPLRASAMPSGSHMRLYRRLQFGNLIDLSVLDTRQWRSDQACGDGSQTDCAEALDPARTMMGAEQEKWLFDNLATREGEVDRARPAGLLVRARSAKVESATAASRWTSGTATSPRAAALQPAASKPRRRTRSSCPATSISTTAPI